MTMQNLQISETAETRIISMWLFLSTSQTTFDLPSAVRMRYWLLPSPRKQRDIYLSKYCKDTRLQNQLSAVQEQHKGLCSILQGASVTLHTILLGVGGTIYNDRTLEPKWSWVLILEELGNLLPSIMFILSIMLPNLFITDVPFPARGELINHLSSGDNFRSSLQPSRSPLILSLFFGAGVLRYPVPKWLLFLIQCGEWLSLPAQCFPLSCFLACYIGQGEVANSQLRGWKHAKTGEI